jgi:hypothetical protein
MSPDMTHRFAAHPNDPAINRDVLQRELVTMLEGYLAAEGR